jgi:hypothetical protein
MGGYPIISISIMRSIEFKLDTSVINVISVINHKLFSHEAVSVSYCCRTLATQISPKLATIYSDGLKAQSCEPDYE